jgi:gliding motility-associated-like protein
MMSIIRSILLLLVGGFINFTTYAQKDTLFYFAAPDVSSGVGQSPIYLRLMTYEEASTITISQPANGGFAPITLTIPAFSLDSVNLTSFIAQIESPAADAVSNNGLKIVATKKISATYEVSSGSNKVNFTLKGNKAFGTNFYTPFQKNYGISTTTPASFSSFEIVATQNATTVLITPRTAITGRAANVSFSITLNAGQTYSARDMNVTAATSLAGSIVASNKPVAITVFEGGLANSTCNDAVGDQITHTGVLGTDYVIEKGTASDVAYVMATQNGTTVSVYNSATNSTVLNWGETYQINLSDLHNYVKTNKPVYVLQTSGFGCELSESQIPPFFCAGDYKTAFTRSNADSLGLILYVRSGFESQFTLNGNASLIPASAFSVVPGTLGAIKAARIYFSISEVPINTYNIVENTGDVYGLGVLSGSTTAGSQFTYMNDFVSSPFVNAGSNDTICANVDFNLNGIVGGGFTTGSWSTTGYGAFASPVTNLTNTYIPSPVDTLNSPILLILTSNDGCGLKKDTLTLHINPSPLVNASIDQTICANNSLVDLNGSVSGGSTSGTWSTSGSGIFVPSASALNANYIPSSIDLQTGNVNLTLDASNIGTCNPVNDVMSINFTSSPVVDAGPSTLTVCANNTTVNVSGSVTGFTTTGKWTTSGNGVFLPNNLQLSSTYQLGTADIANGSVMLYLESTSNGNCITVYDSLLISISSAPIVNAGVDQIVCSNQTSTTLAGTVSGPTSTGVWSGGTGAFSANSNLFADYTPSASELLNGFVILTLSSTNNGLCNAENDIVQLNFVSVPFANFSNTNVCIGDSTSFTDFSLPGSGQITTWEWDFGFGITSTSPNNTVLYSTSGTQDVELIVVASSGCVDTIVKQVEVFGLPQANFTYQTSCPDNNIVVQFTDSSISSDPINFWYYELGGTGVVLAPTTSQLFTESGDYQITHIVSTENNCLDTIVQTVTVPELPQAGFYYNSDNGLNIGASFNFIDTSFYSSSYFWEFGNGDTSIVQDPSNTYFENGVYTVYQFVYNEYGCVDSTFIDITINTVTKDITQLIPNVISPNGDGKNDVWKLEFLDILYPNASVEIYNQWGQQLFYSEGYPVPWDAKYNGELVPEGNYYYVINLNSGGTEDLFKGALLVFKSQK